MADKQRHKEYAWEGEWREWNTTTMTLKVARQYVRWACELYGVKPPRVKSHTTRDCSYSQGSLISFRTDQINCGTALHEAAHHISGAIFGDAIEHHAPEWLAIYLWLLIEAQYCPRSALFASAAAKGLQWVPLWQVSPKRLSRGRIIKRLKPPAR
jgi:hypothetical protein